VTRVSLRSHWTSYDEERRIRLRKAGRDDADVTCFMWPWRLVCRSCKVVGHINKVKLHRASLVLPCCCLPIGQQYSWGGVFPWLLQCYSVLDYLCCQLVAVEFVSYLQ